MEHIREQSHLNKARVDKFLLVMTLPDILKELNRKTNNDRSSKNILFDSLQFSIYGTITPQVIVPAIEQGYAGQFFKVSAHTRPVYPNISVSFNIDNNFNNYWVIFKWLDMLNDQKGSTFSQSVKNDKAVPFNYQSDFTIFAKDEYNKNIAKFTYTKAFPVSLGQIDFNYQQESEIKTTFDFAFSQFHMELI